MYISRKLKSLKIRVLEKIDAHKANVILQNASTLQEFWNESHKTQNLRWLTNSNPESELEFLDFDLNKSSQTRILVVGVGTGSTANYLADRFKFVDAIDISEIALQNLSPKIKYRFTTNNYNLIPDRKYDVVLHHLVAQHMSTKELLLQIIELEKKLDFFGEIRMQIASSVLEDRNDIEELEENQRIGKVLRSPEKLVSEITSKTNLKVRIEKTKLISNWEEGWKWTLLVMKKSQNHVK